MVPNPWDPKCNSFLICSPGRAPVIKKCPDGLRFDPGCECCNHAAKVRCDQQTQGSPAAPTPRPTTARPTPTRGPQRPVQTTPEDSSPCRVLRPGTTLPNPSDATCNSFLVCSKSGEATVNKCPSTLSYNPACKCCDYPSNTACHGIRPTKRPVSGEGKINFSFNCYLLDYYIIT